MVGYSQSRLSPNRPVPAKGRQDPHAAPPHPRWPEDRRYEGVTTERSMIPCTIERERMLAENEADVQKADFTLTNRRTRRSFLELRGKDRPDQLLATWCPRADPRLGDWTLCSRHFEYRVLSSCPHDESAIQSEQFWWRQDAPDVVSIHAQSAPELPL